MARKQKSLTTKEDLSRGENAVAVVGYSLAFLGAAIVLHYVVRTLGGAP